MGTVTFDTDALKDADLENRIGKLQWELRELLPIIGNVDAVKKSKHAVRVLSKRAMIGSMINDGKFVGLAEQFELAAKLDITIADDDSPRFMYEFDAEDRRVEMAARFGVAGAVFDAVSPSLFACGVEHLDPEDCDDSIFDALADQENRRFITEKSNACKAFTETLIDRLVPVQDDEIRCEVRIVIGEDFFITGDEMKQVIVPAMNVRVMAMKRFDKASLEAVLSNCRLSEEAREHARTAPAK